MDDYYKKMIRISEEVVALIEGGSIAKGARTPGTANGTPTPSESGLVADDTETLTYDRAKKILRRVEYFNKLREVVIFDPEVMFCLNLVA